MGLTILSLLLQAAQPVAAPEPEPLTIGETFAVEAVGAQRRINVVLPPSYDAEPDKEWPVVYMVDGAITQDLFMGVGVMRWNSLWGRSQEVIWVGIETKDRQRELLPPTGDAEQRKRYPTAGEAAAFRDWIASSVKPMIEARYRDNSQAFLVGESAAGHFVLETWLRTPAAFDGYAAISPSLQWDDQSLSKSVAVAHAEQKPPIYLSLADEGGAVETGMMRLLASLPEQQSYCFSDRRKDLVHATSLHGLLPEGLQYLLPTKADWLTEFGFTLRCDKGAPAAQ